MKLILVADDFTGANDLGLQLTKYGIKVMSTRKVEGNIEDIVPIVTTESRNIGETEAAKVCKDIYSQLLKRDYDVFYKKIDSTLRGNVLVEVETLKALLPSASKIAVVVPFPQTGRVVIDGRHYVQGEELHKSSFSKDPIKPVKSNIMTDFFRGTVVNLQSIRSGSLEEYLRETKEELLIFDGETEEDLKIIARALKETAWDRHIVGSSAIMEKLMPLYAYSKAPILIVSASCNSKNFEQVDDFLNEVEVNILDYDILKDEIRGRVDPEKDIILRTAHSKEDTEEVLEELKTHEIKEMIGRKAKKLIEEYNIKKIISCGGDISIELMEQLALDNFEILSEIEAGIAYGRSADYGIITKPGGFGTKKIYKKMYSFLKNCR